MDTPQATDNKMRSKFFIIYTDTDLEIIRNTLVQVPFILISTNACIWRMEFLVRILDPGLAFKNNMRTQRMNDSQCQ